MLEIGNDFINIGLAKSQRNQLYIKKIIRQSFPKEALDKSIPTDPISFGFFLKGLLNENNFNTEESIIILRTFLSKAKRILKLAIQFEKNKDINKTINSAKPPIFWKEKNIVKILENENVAYDIGSYRSAPPGLRIWGGPTINPKDITLLLPWLQWAFEDSYKSVKKGN